MNSRMQNDVWTVRPITFECEQGQITVSSPSLNGRVIVSERIAAYLMKARGGAYSGELEPIILDGLVSRGYLRHESQDSGDCQPPAPWRQWGLTAWNYHRRVQDTHFLNGTTRQSDDYVQGVLSEPMPPSHSFDTKPDILLPRIRTKVIKTFLDVLEGRRTHRRFEPHAMPLDTFSDMLHYSFAPLRYVDAGHMGVQQLKAAMSGGARHETEAYIFCFDIEDVPSGLYHYHALTHGLSLIDKDVDAIVFERLTNDQEIFGNACFGVITVAESTRLAWKYPHPVAYRIMQINIGAVAQIFSMMASFLGYGASVTGAIRETEARDILRLRDESEMPTFAMAVGMPQRRVGQLPADVRPPGAEQIDGRGALGAIEKETK